MATRVLIGLLYLTSCSARAAETFPAGLLYGPKAAFTIAAPKGWVLDNQSGQAQGLPCVLYPVGSHWTDAKVLMYAKIASPTYPKAEEFASWAIGEFQKEGGGFHHKRIKDGKTREGYAYFINEYRREKGYSRIERVAYVQLPEAVAYIVFSAEGEELYRKHSSALGETVQSLTYMPRFIGHHE
jgi:hypothetical protein